MKLNTQAPIPRYLKLIWSELPTTTCMYCLSIIGAIIVTLLAPIGIICIYPACMMVNDYKIRPIGGSILLGFIILIFIILIAGVCTERTPMSLINGIFIVYGAYAFVGVMCYIIRKLRPILCKQIIWEDKIIR